VKVEAEGSLDAQGVLHASVVSFRGNLRLQGTVANVAIPEPGAPRTGSFTVLGLLVLTDDFTDWRGLDLDSIGTGPVQVRGYLSRDGSSLVATRVDSTSDTRVFVQGPVTTKDASARTLGILGFTVATTGQTEYRDMSDAAIADPAVFFAAVVEARTVVKARGKDASALVGTTLTAEELELEGNR
jgi:hypothetical protein